MSENALTDIESITDKSVLNSAIEQLNVLSDLLEKVNTVTLTNDEYTKFNADIEALKKQYSERIAVIETEEKAAEEAKKEAEEKKKEESNKNSSNSVSNNNNNSSSSNSSNQNTRLNHIDITNPSSYKYKEWDLDENGNVIEDSVRYVRWNGDVYDYKGDFYFNLVDYGMNFRY